jgi:hypothetical protein
MTNGRAHGWLRQVGIARIADELDYTRDGPWAGSIRNETKSRQRDLLRHTRSRSLRVTVRDLRYVRQTEQSRRQLIRDQHAAAVAALRRCGERNEPFTLLLRDFDAEALSLSTKKRLWGPVVEYRSAAVLSFPPPQDKVRELLIALGAEHPVIAVFNHESRPLTASLEAQRSESSGGIYYLALSPSKWSDFVLGLAEAATMVLVLAGEVGNGLRLELQMLDQLAAHDRTVLVLTNDMREPPVITAIDPDLAAEYARRQAEREAIVSSSLFQRFGRRITLEQLRRIGFGDLAALAAQAPFGGLLPLTEVDMPNAPVQDEGRERLISDARREIEELQGQDNDADNIGRRLELMWTLAATYNELRQYGVSMEWTRRALDVLQEAPIPPAVKAEFSLPWRDSLITGLTNSRQWEEARIELAAQLDNMRSTSASDSGQAAADYDQFAQRMWLHIGRMRRESDVPVQDLVTGLEGWNNARGD